MNGRLDDNNDDDNDDCTAGIYHLVDHVRSMLCFLRVCYGPICIACAFCCLIYTTTVVPCKPAILHFRFGFRCVYDAAAAAAGFFFEGIKMPIPLNQSCGTLSNPASPPS